MTLAIVGMGFMGATHLKAAAGIPNLKLAVVSRDDKKRKGDLSSVGGNLTGSDNQVDFSAVRTFSSFPEMLLDPEVDAVDLCLPTALHESFTIEALRAGKHVLVEKPMGLDRAACDRMIEEAQKADRVLMAAQVLRFFPAYASLKQWVESGDSGTIRTATLRRRCAAPGWGPWLKDKAQSGGGVFDLLIHDIDMALYLFGAPVSVTATGYENLEKQIDVLVGQLYYPGFTVNISGGWHHEGYPFSMEFTVVGDNGTMEYHVRDTHPSLFQAGTPVSEVAPDGSIDGYQAEISYFLECARKNEQPVKCLPVDSARSVALALLLLESRTRHGEKLLCQI
ncbi:Gfo/Idh/MocA family protein [Bryobacter aggregatus]|uniref:Gfo/Idh/MocA family protein n=1 Tax=Bryobacter aggregatus TaxID=360054 RepID=UPI0009B5A76F|nr:Gfo/Idh/MocA family oxidoreductase [Bryobacter aggregatus]